MTQDRTPPQDFGSQPPSQTPSAPPPPPSPGSPHGPWATPPHGPGYTYQPDAGYYAPPQTEGTAVGALITSIASFVACPVIPAVVALVLAATATRKIRESGGRLTGEGMANAARIIAIVHLVLVALVVAVIILLAVGGALDSSTIE